MMITEQETLLCPKDIRSVRISRGYTIQQLSLYTGVPKIKLALYESNPSIMPLDIALKLVELYKVPFSSICFRTKK